MRRVLLIFWALPKLVVKVPELLLAFRYAGSGRSPTARFLRIGQRIGEILASDQNWLSSRTETLGAVRARRMKTEGASVGERFHRLLHRWHTIGASSVLGLVVFASLVVVSVIGGSVLFGEQISERAGTRAQMLVGTATVIGAAAGILFAIIVFGIQFHGERLGQASFLVRYLLRREGLVPIAAVTLGVVAANAVVPLLSAYFGVENSTLLLALLDVLLIPGVLWLALWLLYRIGVSVSGDFFSSLLPGLAWEYDRALDEENHHALQVKEYAKLAEEAGLSYVSGAGMVDMDVVPPVCLKLQRRGTIADVHVPGLTALGNYIKARLPGYEATLGLGPGDLTCAYPHGAEVTDHIALVLSPAQDELGWPRAETPPISATQESKVAQLLHHCFRVTARRERDMPEVLSRFAETLVSQAKHDRADHFERALRVQEHLIERRLQRKETETAEFSFYRRRLPDSLGDAGYSDMAEGVVLSGDRDKINTLMGFAYRLMGLSIDSRNAALSGRAGQIIKAVYDRALRHAEIADFVGESIDRWILGVVDSFAFRRSWRLEPAQVTAEMPVLIAKLSWHLGLLRLALDAGREEDATHFHERVYEWDRHHRQRHVRRHSPVDVAPEMQDVHDLHGFVEMVLAAWCLHVLKTKGKHGDLASALFKECLSELGNRHDLLRVWEVVEAKPYAEGDMAERLGVTTWSMHISRRARGAASAGLPDAWVFDGLLALMLYSRPARKHEIPEHFDMAPARCPPAEDYLKARLQAHLTDESVCKGLLGIADDKRDEAARGVLGIFSRRRYLHELERMRRVVGGTVHRDRCQALRHEITAELQEHRELLQLLARMGGRQRGAQAWFMDRIRVARRIRKEVMLAGYDRDAGFGPGFAKNLADQENVQIARGTERLAGQFDVLNVLAFLPEAVRAARKELKTRGLDPCLIFLPGQPGFVEALTEHASWQLPGRGTLGGHHAGEWEGCQVVVWPYEDTSSIAVVDARAFYGQASGDADSALGLVIEEPWGEDHQKWLAQAEGASDPGAIRTAEHVHVLAAATLLPAIGIHDARAALRIELDLTRLGHAMREGESVFHRPDCPLLAGARTIEYSLAHRLPADSESRHPCEQCKPDDGVR